MENKPQHDKTNKWLVRQAKTQISLGIRPVWTETSPPAWGKLGSFATHWAKAKTLIRLGGCPGWSESSLAHMSFCWFCHAAAQIIEYENSLSVSVKELVIPSTIRSSMSSRWQSYMLCRRWCSISTKLSALEILYLQNTSNIVLCMLQFWRLGTRIIVKKTIF